MSDSNFARAAAATSKGAGALELISAWLCQEGRLHTLFALIALPLLGVECYYVFMQMGFFMAHDEAEHLHVVFALERGEVPYRDFIENHPVFFHIIVLELKRLFDLTTAMDVYWLGKSLVTIHFLACMFLLMIFFAGLSRRNDLGKRSFLAIPAVFSLLGIWNYYEQGYGCVWQVRPDWLCYFYSFLCIFLHYDFHRRLFGGSKTSLPLVLAGAISGGIASAILAKSIYVFLPYALTLIFLLVNKPQNAIQLICQNWRSLLVANVFFLLVGAAVFFLLVYMELSISNAGAVEYYRANFLMNSVKHLISRSEDFNPFNVLREFLGLPLSAAILLSLSFFLVFSSTHHRRKQELFAVMVFIIFCILMNAALPAYTNGLVWPQYFIPSLLMMVLSLAILAASLIRYIQKWWIGALPTFIGGSGRLCHWAPIFFTLAGLSFFVTHWQSALEQIDSLDFSSKLREVVTQDSAPAFLSEKYMDPDLVYMTFVPHKIPIEAKTWSYFFMLGADQNLWRDNYSFGIGPDPKTYWQELFVRKRPDVIALQGFHEFQARKLMLKHMQQVDIDWLWPKMQSDYQCLSKRTLRNYVRNDLVAKMTKSGWVPCPVAPDLRTDDDVGK
jgi:hypothetical protein